MFPAPAGMNRTARMDALKNVDVPRTRGDEPAIAYTAICQLVCSPHPRG